MNVSTITICLSRSSFITRTHIFIKITKYSKLHEIRSLIFYYVFQEFLRKSDVSLSGDLDMSEFINYLQQHENQLRIVFSTLDQNKDGK